MMQSETHLYLPRTNLEQSEMTMLETAKLSVDVAMHSFTDRELAEELAQLARKGVHFRVCRDREQYDQKIRQGRVNTTATRLTP